MLKACLQLSGSPFRLFLYVFDLTGARLFRAAGSFDSSAHIDVVVVVATFHVVEAPVTFGEWR